MSDFIRRPQNDWSDLSGSDESTETTCAFEIGNMFAKAKKIKASSAIIQEATTSHFRITNKDAYRPAENRDFAQNADNCYLPHLPAFRAPTIPKARDCLNPSDSDVSVLVVRKPQAMCRPMNTSGMATRRDCTTRETVQKVGEVFSSSSKNRGKIKHCESFDSTDLLRREVYRRQTAGPTINKISSEKINHSASFSEVLNAVKSNTFSPREKLILIEALVTSSKFSDSQSNVSRRSLQGKKRQLSSSVKNGYPHSSSVTSSSDNDNYFSPYRRKQYKQNTKKSFNMYYNKPPTLREHFTSGTSHNTLSKSRKLFTFGTDSENEDEKLREECLQKVQMDIKTRQCYVAIERLPSEVLESALPQSKKVTIQCVKKIDIVSDNIPAKIKYGTRDRTVNLTDFSRSSKKKGGRNFFLKEDVSDDDETWSVTFCSTKAKIEETNLNVDNSDIKKLK